LTFQRVKNNAEKTSGFDPKKKKQTLFFRFSQRTSGPPKNQRILGKTSGNRKNKRAPTQGQNHSAGKTIPFFFCGTLVTF